MNNILNYIEGYEICLGTHDVMCHMYGPTKCFMTVHVEVDASGDLLEVHDEIDNIEKAVYQEFGALLTIHMDPIQTDNEEINALKERANQAILAIDSRLSFHDFRVVVGPTHTNILFDVVVPFGFKMCKDEIIKHLDATIKDEGKQYYFVIEVEHKFVKDNCK